MNRLNKTESAVCFLILQGLSISDGSVFLDYFNLRQIKGNMSNALYKLRDENRFTLV